MVCGGLLSFLGKKVLIQIRVESRRAKTGLKIFDIGTPKEDLASTRSSKPSSGMALTMKYNWKTEYISIVSVVPKEGLVRQ